MKDKLRFLLINPWVYDFAAFNLWSCPLGLFKVAEFLSQFPVELHCIDCTEDYKKVRYNKGRYPKTVLKKPHLLKDIPRNYCRYGMEIDDFKTRLKKLQRPDAVFVTSLMTYWYPGVLSAVDIVREFFPNTLIILGGIYATLYCDHAQAVIAPDIIHTGPIAQSLLNNSPFFILRL